MTPKPTCSVLGPTISWTNADRVHDIYTGSPLSNQPLALFPVPQLDLIRNCQMLIDIFAQQVIVHIITSSSISGHTSNITRAQYYQTVYIYISTTRSCNEKTDIISKIDDPAI